MVLKVPQKTAAPLLLRIRFRMPSGSFAPAPMVIRSGSASAVRNDFHGPHFFTTSLSQPNCAKPAGLILCAQNSAVSEEMLYILCSDLNLADLSSLSPPPSFGYSGIVMFPLDSLPKFEWWFHCTSLADKSSMLKLTKQIVVRCAK